MTQKRSRAAQVVEYVALWPVYLLGKVLPKRRDLFVIGSSLGHHFADNAKYLTIYLADRHPEVEAVFVTRSPEVLAHLKRNGVRTESLRSFRGVWSILRAKRCFITHSTLDLHPVLMGGSEIVQMWHGTPLRKISYDADFAGSKSNPVKNAARRFVYALFPYLYDATVFDRICISSEGVRESFLSAFRTGEERLEIVGQPRNDCLVDDSEPEARFFPEVELLRRIRASSDFIVAWLPTHRSPTPIDASHLMFDHGFDQSRWEEFLERFNARLVLKPHFLERDALAQKLEPSDRILIYEPVDPYPLLRTTDVLVTDYSSVYFDFLLLDRPVVFAPFDKERYLREVAGFYYDYDEVTPGPQCRSWPELLPALEQCFAALKSGAEDPHADARHRVRDRFNRHRDGFSQRVAERFILG